MGANVLKSSMLNLFTNSFRQILRNQKFFLTFLCHVRIRVLAAEFNSTKKKTSFCYQCRGPVKRWTHGRFDWAIEFGSLTSRLFKQQRNTHTHPKLKNSHPHLLACNLNVLQSLGTSDSTPVPFLVFVGFFMRAGVEPTSFPGLSPSNGKALETRLELSWFCITHSIAASIVWTFVSTR